MRVNPRFLMLPLLVVLLCARVRPADEEKWAVFGSRGRVEVSASDVNGVAYVDLVQALAGEVNASAESTRKGLRVKAAGEEWEIQDGDRGVRIRGRSIPLSAPAIVQENSARVPVTEMAAILRAVTRKNVLTRPGRIFVGDTADFANTQLRPGEPSSLILNFRGAVNPRVSADAKTITLTFDRDPAVLSAPQSGFDDKTIASVQSNEQNGTAAITVIGQVPLMVKFEDENRRIVVTAAPSAAAVEPAPSPTANTPPPAPAEPSAVGASAEPGAAQTEGQAANGSAKTAVVAIDPAHGGTDAGVRFSEKLVEKDVTLALAEKIKAELGKLGISSILLRNADENPGADERAEMANGARVSFYIGVHAGQGGNGVRLYTELPSAAQARSVFLPWEQAQAGYRDRSVAFAGALTSQFGSKKVASRQLLGNTAPVMHVAAAAVSIEVAPDDRDDEASLESQSYQQKVAQAVAAAVAGERGR